MECQGKYRRGLGGNERIVGGGDWIQSFTELEFRNALDQRERSWTDWAHSHSAPERSEEGFPMFGRDNPDLSGRKLVAEDDA